MSSDNYKWFLSAIIGAPVLTQSLPNSRLRFTVDVAAAITIAVHSPRDPGA